MMERTSKQPIHTDAQKGVAWTPVLYFNDGRVLKIGGRWPHDEAMAMAEQAASHLDGAESFGAQRLR